MAPPDRPAGRNGDARPDNSDVQIAREIVEEAERVKALSADDEKHYLALAQRGDRPAQDRLVAANLRLVVRIAKERPGAPMSFADLVQEGSIGLVEAVRTFTSSEEPDFQEYAAAMITRSMNAAIERDGVAVRDAQLLVVAATDYEQAEISLMRELKRVPTEAEMAAKLEWTVDRTQYVAGVVAEARRRHDEELLAFVDPASLDYDEPEGPAGQALNDD